MVGEKIRALRKQKGLSQEAVAEHLHISQSTYARIEKGENSSWAAHLEQLCDFFEVSPEELMKTESLVVNQKHQVGNSYNAHVISHELSEKLITQYEQRMAEKDVLIAELRGRIAENNVLIRELRERLKKQEGK